jgi:hypothetical protein
MTMIAIVQHDDFERLAAVSLVSIDAKHEVE